MSISKDAYVAHAEEKDTHVANASHRSPRHRKKARRDQPASIARLPDRAGKGGGFQAKAGARRIPLLP